MATVHPSRMGLVPQDPKKTHTSSYRRRSPSPRSAIPSRSLSREGGRNGNRDKDNHRSSYRDNRDDDIRGRGHSRDHARDGHRDGDRRRASPQYDDYRRPPPPVEGSAPWRQPENMYPNRRGDIKRDRPHGGAGADFMESRRLQRESQVVNVWPSSPKAPARSSSPKRNKSSRKSKRPRSPSTSESSSDEDRRRRERKEKKRAKREREKEKEREGHSERRRRRSRSPRRSYDDDSEDDRRRHRSRQSATKTRSRSRSRDVRLRSPARSPPPSEHDDDDWVVKPPPNAPPVAMHSEAKQSSLVPPPAILASNDSDDSGDEVGPQPVVRVNASKRFDERSYGGALLRGEGSAMAAFLQDGTESRIPRRGEIGLTSDEIAKYEDVGYVMSGSRHRRMNAVRMRKENQVISAEEKRGILKLQREERERRESILREEFNELVNERLKGVPNGPK